MKKVVIAGLLAATMGLAHAQLSWTSRGTDVLTDSFDPSPDIGLTHTASTMEVGDLHIALQPRQSAKVSFTLLGREAGWGSYLSDMQFHDLFDGNMAFGTQAVLQIDTGYNGALPFVIFDPNAQIAYNGGNWDPDVSIGLLATNFTATGSALAGKHFQYVIGFNDSSPNSNDWDDLVIGVNVAAVNAVPEPSTYAMLLGGLGAIGFVGSRRRAPR